MKTTEEIAVKAQPAYVRKVEKTLCDFCGSTSFKSCWLCKRDTCREHGNFDPEEYGDYPAWYCDKCHLLKFVTYSDDRQAIRQKADDQEQELEERIKQESLSQNNVA